METMKSKDKVERSKNKNEPPVITREYWVRLREDGKTTLTTFGPYSSEPGFEQIVAGVTAWAR